MRASEYNLITCSLVVISRACQLLDGLTSLIQQNDQSRSLASGQVAGATQSTHRKNAADRMSLMKLNVLWEIPARVKLMLGSSVGGTVERCISSRAHHSLLRIVLHILKCFSDIKTRIFPPFLLFVHVSHLRTSRSAITPSSTSISN